MAPKHHWKGTPNSGNYVKSSGSAEPGGSCVLLVTLNTNGYCVSTHAGSAFYDESSKIVEQSNVYEYPRIETDTPPCDVYFQEAQSTITFPFNSEGEFVPSMLNPCKPESAEHTEWSTKERWIKKEDLDEIKFVFHNNTLQNAEGKTVPNIIAYNDGFVGFRKANKIYQLNDPNIRWKAAMDIGSREWVFTAPLTKEGLTKRFSIKGSWSIPKVIEDQKLVNRKFEAMDFSRTTFRRTTFEKCEFLNCNFSKMQYAPTKEKESYSAAIFSAYQLTSCNFEDADFTGCKFNKSTTLLNCNLKGKDESLCEKDLSQVDFDGCDFSGRMMGGVRKKGGKMVNCKIGCVLGGEFIGANMQHCSFEYDELKPEDFSGINFEGCDLSHSNFESCDLTSASFINAVLSGVNFEGCLLNNAQFRGSTLQRANFEDADLDGAIGFDKLASANKLSWKEPKPFVKEPLPPLKYSFFTVMFKILKGSAFAAMGETGDEDEDEGEDDEGEEDDGDEEEEGDDEEEHNFADFEAKFEKILSNADDCKGLIDDLINGKIALNMDTLSAAKEKAMTTTTGAKVAAKAEEMGMAARMKVMDGLKRKLDDLPSSSLDSPKFLLCRKKFEKALKNKKSLVVQNAIGEATGFSVQMGANYLSSLVLAGQTPAPRLKKQLGELTYLMECLEKCQEPVLLATLSDSIEDWKGLYELQHEFKGERARSILLSVFADPSVIIALGLADQLGKARVAPPGFLKVVKNNLSAHMKQNFFRYRRQVMKEENAIERVMAKQQQIITLGMSLFTSICIGFFGFLGNLVSGIILNFSNL
ncbi:hypothetical protein ScalyP_jg9676 [Parmales sp. scaly parma]|nr:hypothetical protein ScalyP_jg9676 [Parmales sp. scaly parma]